MNKRRTARMVIFTWLALTLCACGIIDPPVTATPFAYPIFTPSPWFPAVQETEYAAAQATQASGESEMEELNRQATLVSQNIAWAAATQQSIAHQTQMVWNATATVQSQDATIVAQNQDATATAQSQDATATAQVLDATATDVAYLRNVTETALAQVMLDVQATQSAQANAAQASFSLTATSQAAIQAGIVRTRDESNRRAWWREFIVTPLKVILITLVVLLFIVGAVMAYRRLMPVLELRLRTIWRDSGSPLLLADGTILDHDATQPKTTHWVLRQPDLPQYPTYETPPVEIIDPLDPSIALWIAETEQKLSDDGRIQL